VLGGGEIYVEQIVDHLHNEFAISILGNHQLLRRIEPPIEKSKLAGFPFSIERNVPGGYRVKQFYHYLRHRSAFTRKHTDLVHCQTYDERLLNLLMPGLKRQNIPALITMHQEFTPAQIRANRYRPEILLSQFSAVICACNATKKNLVSFGIPTEKCHVIYNGVDARKFIPNGAPGKFVTWIGRVDGTDKNPQLFVRIAELAQRRNLPFQFRLVGEGRLLPSIREYVRTAEIRNLQLYGWAPDPRQIYREARLLCMTSTTEGLPLVAAEAMASGVPIVASKAGGLTELIKDESVGSLVPTWNEADFLEAITLLCEDSSRHAAVSRSARGWVEQAFSLDRMLSEVRKLYRSLLAGGSS
jgi:glycosyltransferase involved in cell wall biosynthesis